MAHKQLKKIKELKKEKHLIYTFHLPCPSSFFFNWISLFLPKSGNLRFPFSLFQINNAFSLAKWDMVVFHFLRPFALSIMNMHDSCFLLQLDLLFQIKCVGFGSIICNWRDFLILLFVHCIDSLIIFVLIFQFLFNVNRPKKNEYGNKC